MSELKIIDPHQHFWDLGMKKHPWLIGEAQVPFRYGDYSVIRKNFLPEDYLAASAKHHVVKTVHMEAEWETSSPVEETAWIHKLHDETGFPHALIGQVWFCRDDVKEVLKGHAAYPLSRSVREKPTASPSAESFQPGLPGSMADPAFREGYANLSRFGFHFDLQTPWWHLGEAGDLARDFPDTLIILNHSGLPADRSEAGLAGWREFMERFADQPNTAVKISGICVPDKKWTADLNGGIVRDIIRIFGVDRCMFASNMPVDSIVSSFDDIYSGFKKITAPMGRAVQEKLFHDNAMRVYRPV